MLAKLFFLIAAIIFVATALGANITNALYWGLGSLSIGFLLEGYNVKLG